MSTLVLGIDEAGRGPALGSMVLAAVALTPASSRRLSRAGVADSKSFGAGPDAHAARLELFKVIADVAQFIAFEVCDVETIDAYVARGALNVLERERADRMIRRAPACKRIVADGRRLFGDLRASFPHLEAVDRGESCHVAVTAASICAKVRRDELFACIAARYEAEFGPVRGSGYVNAATRTFTKAYQRKYGHLPPEARQTWPWPKHGGAPGYRVVAPVADAPPTSAPPVTEARAGVRPAAVRSATLAAGAEEGRAGGVDTPADGRAAAAAG